MCRCDLESLIKMQIIIKEGELEKWKKKREKKWQRQEGGWNITQMPTLASLANVLDDIQETKTNCQ